MRPDPRPSPSRSLRESVAVDESAPGVRGAANRRVATQASVRVSPNVEPRRLSGLHIRLPRLGRDWTEDAGPNREAHGADCGQTVMGETANYTQERSVNQRGAQLVRTGIVAGRSGKR
jgi:hypothetical protein